MPADVDAVGVAAHAHYLAKEAKLTATLPTGEVRILLWIRQWEFNWQDQYQFQDLVPLPKGTRLDGELTYDNSADNYRNPNTPPKTVRWGENSTDEMGSLLLNVLPRQAGDIALLQTASIVYVLTPVPLVGSKPLFVSSGIVDGASAQPGAVTPGKIVVLYGSRLGPATLTGASIGGDGKVATNAGGTQVLFDGVPAPILYTSSGQVAAIVPYAVDGKPGTQVQVRNGSLTSDPVAMPVFAGGALDFLGGPERHRTGRGPESGRPHRQLREESGRQRQLHFDLCDRRRPDRSRRNRRPDRHRRQSAEAGAPGSGLGGWQAGRSAIRRRGAQCGGGIVPGQCAHPVERLPAAMSPSKSTWAPRARKPASQSQ